MAARPAKQPWSARPRAGRARRAACLFAACCVLASGVAFADRPSSDTAAEVAATHYLWPGRIAPGSAGVDIAQRIVERSDDPALPDRIITGITRPHLVVYRPAHPNGAALLVMPGGAYRRIVLDKEGSALAPVFAEQLGYTLFVLRYRLPGEGHVDARDAPLADAQRAIRLIRANAEAWGVDPERVAAIGFSAGGHVAASLAMRYDDALATPVDQIDRIDARPDAVLLLYPVIDMGEHAHAVSRGHLLGPDPSPRSIADYSLQNRVRADMPPVFLLHAADDASVDIGNTLQLYRALRAAGVATEMHLYPEGGHGFGVRDIGDSPLAEWPRIADAWLRSLETED